MEKIDEEVFLPKHIAIIMDGNRRWATGKGLFKLLGHKEGAENLKRISKYANEIGIKYLTVYAFSTENWKRSKEEVTALMTLLKDNLIDYINNYTGNIRIRIIGSSENISDELKELIQKIQEKTANNTGMTLNIAFNYGGRNEIVNTTKKIAQKVKNGELDIEKIDEEVFAQNIYTAGQPDPDLLIRTSGEERISNFLLWQIAYSEFYFTKKYWPEFGPEDLDFAIKEYSQRNRKFGGK